MKIKIGIIGCGPWADIIINNIEKNNKLKLEYVVCHNKVKLEKFKSNYLVFDSFEDLINKHTPKALYLAGNPSSYLKIINKASELNLSLIHI